MFCALSSPLANLGVASFITVIIAASDDAHGVFQFSDKSLSVTGTEPEQGRSNITLQVRGRFHHHCYHFVLGEHEF